MEKVRRERERQGKNLTGMVSRKKAKMSQDRNDGDGSSLWPILYADWSERGNGDETMLKKPTHTQKNNENKQKAKL